MRNPSCYRDIMPELSMARISLIIPTFNRPYFLKRCVESALLAGSDVEVIVVDDARRIRLQVSVTNCEISIMCALRTTAE